MKQKKIDSDKILASKYRGTFTMKRTKSKQSTLPKKSTYSAFDVAKAKEKPAYVFCDDCEYKDTLCDNLDSGLCNHPNSVIKIKTPFNIQSGRDSCYRRNKHNNCKDFKRKETVKHKSFFDRTLGSFFKS